MSIPVKTSLDAMKGWNPTWKYLDRVPRPTQYNFGPHKINREYREVLYNRYPFYTTEEIVGSYLGHNPYFPSQRDWLNNSKRTYSECDSESEDDSEWT